MKISNLVFMFEKNSINYFFHNVSVTFASNAVNFIQGNNGVGKSTLFNILQGNVNSHALCTMGITIDGKTYIAQNNLLPYDFTQHVHTVQQDYDRMIADQFSFIQNLQLASMPLYPGLRPLPNPTLFSVITTLDIDMHKPACLLSGGQRQLLAILMALQKPTKVLLLDEPTATLDPKNTDLIIQCLNELAQQLKVTMLIICHDITVVEQYGKTNRFVLSVDDRGRRCIEKIG